MDSRAVSFIRILQIAHGVRLSLAIITMWSTLNNLISRGRLFHSRQLILWTVGVW